MNLKTCKVLDQLSRVSSDIDFDCTSCPFDECYDMETKVKNAHMLCELNTAMERARNLQENNIAVGDDELYNIMWDLLKCEQRGTAKKIIANTLNGAGYERTAKLFDDNFKEYDQYKNV